LPPQFGTQVQTPLLHVSEPEHEPHEPPQLSEPQFLPAHCGTHEH
jgi:hypothetical protein